jgi:hypothetical protein
MLLRNAGQLLLDYMTSLLSRSREELRSSIQKLNNSVALLRAYELISTKHFISMDARFSVAAGVGPWSKKRHLPSPWSARECSGEIFIRRPWAPVLTVPLYSRHCLYALSLKFSPRNNRIRSGTQITLP